MTSSLENENYGGRRYLPFVFTEQGIAMLSGLLRNKIAVQVSINTMNAFVEMRKFINLNKQLFYKINNITYKLTEYDKKFDIVFNELQKIKKEEFKEKIFFEGQIYDAYSLIIKLIKRAKQKITIIDNSELYHCGASLKDLERKCFAITKMEEENLIEKIG